MARVTVEDCKKYINNRFEMVILAACRARQIALGSPPLVDSKDKDVVLALREIGTGKIDPQVIYHEMVKNYKKLIAKDLITSDREDDEISELLSAVYQEDEETLVDQDNLLYLDEDIEKE